MLNIRMGVAIRAKYTFAVERRGDNTPPKEYFFINEVLNDEALRQHGKDIVVDMVSFGTSNNPDSQGLNTSLVAVNKRSISKVIPINSYSVDYTGKLAAVKSSIAFVVDGFNASDKTPLQLNEFAIEGYSRIVLVDPDQDLNGLYVGPKDKVKVIIDFEYIYYTNRLIATLAENVYGKQVDYTSEVLKIHDKAIRTVRLNPGYAGKNPIDIFPIVKDIRNIQTEDIIVPIRDKFQQEINKLDIKSNRIDAEVIGYYDRVTTIYGFTLRDNIRGIAILVRFSEPVKLAAEKRYGVKGYIQWGNKVGDLDDGYSTIDGGKATETIPVNADADGTISIPLSTPDVAVDMASLDDIRLQLDALNINIDLSSATTWERLQALLMNTGAFADVELFSNRPPLKQPSMYQYTVSNASYHSNAVAAISQLENNAPFIYPTIIAGGDYSVEATSNGWRIDAVVPYFGDLTAAQYIAYGLFDISGLASHFENLPVSIKDVRPLSTISVENEIPNTYTGAELLMSAIRDVTGARSMLVYKAIPVNGAAPVTVNVVSDNDFDTPDYLDWVHGTSSMRLNLTKLDLRTEVTSDVRYNTTSFDIVVDPTRHVIECNQVWINGVNYGNLAQINTTALLALGVVVTKETVDNVNRYRVTYPYNNSYGRNINIYIIGNEHTLVNRGEVAYIAPNGSHGLKVYNPVGSDVSANLVVGNNPFMFAGVTLFQPLPDYIFKFKFLTAVEAARYFTDDTIVNVLPTSLFTVDVGDNDRFNISIDIDIDWRSEYLDGRKLYPGVGIDLSLIGATIPDDSIIFVDEMGRSWSKSALLNSASANPHLVVDGIYMFVTPVGLEEGTSAWSGVLTSEYYDQEMPFSVNKIVDYVFVLETAEIENKPFDLTVDDNLQMTYTFFPERAPINSVVWTSSNPAVASISDLGMVTALRAGDVVIRLVLNGSVIATADLHVGEKELIISCAGANNITPCIDITGTTLGLVLNETPVLTEANAAGIYDYINDSDNLRVINCAERLLPNRTNVSETNFITIEGTVDLYIDGTLVARNVTEQQVLEILSGDSRITIYPGED